jgi:trans-aconitate methyltransferase
MATEWDAQGYARISELQAEMAAEALALVKLKGNERVLDVGCGNGKITAGIAARVPQGSVVGVDPSGEMIAYSNKQYSANHPNLSFRVADARNLGFHQEFDLVVSFNALHWVPDQDAALHSIANALVPGGIAQLRLVYRGERKSLEDVIEETRQSSRWASFYKDFSNPYLHLTPEQYASVAERNGLKVVNIKAASKTWDFHSRDAFDKFGSVTFAAWTSLLPPERREEFIDDVLDRYLGPGGPSHDSLFLYYQMDVTAQVVR